VPWHDILWGVLANVGQFDEAFQEAKQFHTLLGNAGVFAGVPEHVGGEREYQAAMRLAAETKAEQSRKEYVSPAWVSQLYATAGETEAALDWLERAFEERSPWMPGLRGDAHFASLRNEPRFQDLVRRMNFPQ
jgi:hypothetical protein